MSGNVIHPCEPSRRRRFHRMTPRRRVDRSTEIAHEVVEGGDPACDRPGGMEPAVETGGSGEELRWLRRVAEHAAESIFVTDASGVIEYVNPAFTSLTGYTSVEAVGRKPGFLSWGTESTETYGRLWETICRGQVFRDTFANRRKNGERYCEEKTIRALLDAQGRITHYVSTGRDVTGRIMEIERLRHLADHDALTGLPNKRRFSECLRDTLRVDRTGSGLALMYVDVDDFKAINDRLGHAAGDAMLKIVARRLVEAVGSDGIVGRLAGDEFGAILHDLPSRESVTEILERLIGTFAVPVAFGDDLVPLSVSIGVHLCPSGAYNETAVLERADRAMYVAKRAGGLRYAFFVDGDSPVAAAEERRMAG